MSGQKQIVELQSLRGIAAAVVLLHHASFAYIARPATHYAVEVALNAHAAVMLFFVLSGYVLALSMLRSDVTPEVTAAFYVRRLFRIYPAALVASLFALGVRLALPASYGAAFSDWFHAEVQHTALGTADLLRDFLTMKNDIIPPLWSIRVELFCSALIPFLVLAAKKGFALPVALVLIAVTLSGHMPAQLLYLASFSLGVLLTRLNGWFARLPWRGAVMAAAIIVLVFGRLINPAWRFEAGYGALVPIVFESLAAAVLIGCITASGLTPLRARPLVWLGDVSYSIYIWHFPVMIALAFALSPLASVQPGIATVLLMTTTLAVTLAISHLSYRSLEVPGIKLGSAAQKLMRRQIA